MNMYVKNEVLNGNTKIIKVVLIRTRRIILSGHVFSDNSSPESMTAWDQQIDGREDLTLPL